MTRVCGKKFGIGTKVFQKRGKKMILKLNSFFEFCRLKRLFFSVENLSVIHIGSWNNLFSYLSIWEFEIQYLNYQKRGIKSWGNCSFVGTQSKIIPIQNG